MPKKEARNKSEVDVVKPQAQEYPQQCKEARERRVACSDFRTFIDELCFVPQHPNHSFNDMTAAVEKCHCRRKKEKETGDGKVGGL